MGCLAPMSFFSKLAIVSSAPPVVLLFLVLCYLLPSMYRARRDASDENLLVHKQHRTQIRFWKLVLFGLFLIYPYVSSNAIKFFVCREVPRVRAHPSLAFASLSLTPTLALCAARI